MKIENASTTAQDRPVYHNARKAIENVNDAIGNLTFLDRIVSVKANVITKCI
ncbi:hypothetical protein [Anaerotignum sp.]|uniref:hypothetical protein n=1 Tax=Anaerotignum sp. TaxID=2039241 RepID=UPI002899E32D|nr:hypothetical protein [Anaerotignum sp.]